MADTVSVGQRSDRPQTLREWAQGLAPGLDVVSSSVPEPKLQAGDTLAVFRTVDDARELVLAWERIEPADESVGFVALGTAPDRQAERERPAGADPEGVTGHTLRRVLKGAIPGAAVGAAVVGVTAALITESGAAVGGAFGGAAFGAVAGGVLTMVKGTGWSEAYEHSFVDPSATDVVVASFHSDDPARVSEAEQAALAVDGARLARVKAGGHVTAYDPRLSAETDG